jgi:glycosyl transferase family 25
MNKINKFFEEIHCINLDRRQDRWQECQQEFEKHNLLVERFSAIDGKTLEKHPTLNPGQVGAIYSHRGVIELAKEKNLENILILEDDVQFDENLNIKFSEIYNRIPDDWDIILFGGNHTLNNPWGRGELFFVDKNVYKITYSLALHCYAVKSTIYDRVVDVYHKMDKENDVLFAELQKDVNCYILRPHLAWQRPSFSDLCEEFSDYEFLHNDTALFNA